MTWEVLDVRTKLSGYQETIPGNVMILMISAGIGYALNALVLRWVRRRDKGN